MARGILQLLKLSNPTQHNYMFQKGDTPHNKDLSPPFTMFLPFVFIEKDKPLDERIIKYITLRNATSISFN